MTTVLESPSSALRPTYMPSRRCRSQENEIRKIQYLRICYAHHVSIAREASLFAAASKQHSPGQSSTVPVGIVLGTAAWGVRSGVPAQAPWASHRPNPERTAWSGPAGPGFRGQEGAVSSAVGPALLSARARGAPLATRPQRGADPAEDRTPPRRVGLIRSFVIVRRISRGPLPACLGRNRHGRRGCGLPDPSGWCPSRFGNRRPA